MAINLAERMVPIMDAVYKKSSLTAPFEVNPDNIKFDGVKTVKIFDLDPLQGLGDYDRANGYKTATVGNTWNSYTLTKDRGRSFPVIDVMDDEETMGLLFGKLVGEFMRTKTIPELDAYRFASLAGASGITKVSADIGASTKPFDLLDEAEEVMGDEEVPDTGKLLFVSEKFYRSIKNAVVRSLVNENGVNRTIETYNGMEVRRVPKGRFCTDITLLNGGSGQTDGGFKFTASTSKPINFMIVSTPSIVCVTKHDQPRIFDPMTNQQANAWRYDYRVYHDIFVRQHREKGIYVHTGATAINADING